MSVRIERHEIDLRSQVKRAGGKWNPGKKVWELRYDQVLALGLEDRIVEGSR